MNNSVNPIALDYKDLKYYDTKIKKYIDEKDAELAASFSQFSDLPDTVAELKVQSAVHEEAIANLKDHIDEDEAAIVELRSEINTLEQDDKIIQARITKTQADLATLKLDIATKVDREDLTELATKDFVAAEIAKAELSGKEVDLTNYYTKTETDLVIQNAISNIPAVDLSSYVTKSDLEAVQNIAGQNSVKLFVIESELFDIDKKLETIPTKLSELDNDAGFITSIPSEYITESELESKGYITEHQSLDNYATKEFVEDSIESVEQKIPSLDGYATEQYVLDHVNTTIETEVETQVKDEVAEQLAKNEKINYGTFGEI